MTEVQIERMATGGESVARLSDGRVVFVRGALPGELVDIELTEEKKRFARGDTTRVITVSPHRVDEPCSHAAAGQCGGCDWMYCAPTEQRSFKLGIVVEQLQRLGGIAEPTVTLAEHERGQRTTVRCSVTDSRAGYRALRSDQTFAATTCRAAHPLLEELIIEGRFGDASEVTLRLGVATAERMVITDGDPATVVVPEDVVVVSRDNPGDAAIHETVGGRSWRISAGSFFQTSAVGAEALVSSVRSALSDSEGDVIDLYAGVGLLGGAVAAERLVCSVESNPSSVADAKHNLGPGARVDHGRVEHWRPRAASALIADPARRGLAKGGVVAVEATGATHLVLVSCDPASLGRDAALLAEQGWRHDRGEVIDMFPDTSRIEVVSTFSR